ncbi:ABC1 domain protein [Ophiocordyceps sinensis CO18]|uniref:ABC1 domain protein n=1 Tax=Ophiocordyceps sinensis (strain Co18 / CGMCC 3.14243) TaxID=911162 RepID=T5AAT1_OPHSC|nr:ABC1 domain protein [Ophiocordyceps sinensis CO18]
MSSMLFRSIQRSSRAVTLALPVSRPVCSSAPSDVVGSIARSIAKHHVHQISGPFQLLRPPSPGELGAPRAAEQYRRGRRWTRWAFVMCIAGGTVYLVDRLVYASGFARTLRTFGTTLLVAIDYKINFRPEPLTAGSVPDLHTRNAVRLFELLRANGGLYLKIGQAIAMQSAVLPPEFQKMFSRMFDDAPQDDWKDVEKVIRQDFGKSVEEVFGVSFTGEEAKGLMERKARASASVAQVHWARLPDGREVAIKIQKREIAQQVSWDLWAFKTVAWIYSKWFDIPFYTLVPYIAERLELETDFVNEAKNSARMRDLVNAEKSLRGRVYVPTVYQELTTRRVLTTEWIEGVRLWDQAAMTSRWLGGNGKGSPGAKSPLPPVDVEAARWELRTRPLNEKIKPERQEWKGTRGRGGLGLSTKEVMTTMVDLFSAQIFKWGVVHCDPHPGNIFIRRLPNGRAELVLIDHGLYVYMSPRFRQQYATFWKALMTFDNKTIAKVTDEWGIKGADLFASATLMRPYEGGDSSTRSGVMKGLEGETAAERHYAMQQRMKQGIRDMLADEEKLPKELIFIGRNMRIVQGNNQYLGSPVNRARQWLGLGGGMEDAMEKRMKDVAQQDYGIELQHDVFDG